MAGPYFVNDDASSPADGNAWSSGTYGDTWERAYSNIYECVSANTFAAGEIIYIGDDTVDDNVYAAHFQITGPTTGASLAIISSDVLTGTNVSYSAGTAAQIETGDGAYDIEFINAIAVYGINMVSGRSIIMGGSYRAEARMDGCAIKIAAAGAINLTSAASTTYGEVIFENNSIDCTASASSTVVFNNVSRHGNQQIRNITFTNADQRTGSVFYFNVHNGHVEVSSCDFSGFTNATVCEIANLSDTASVVRFAHCKTKSSPTLLGSGTPYASGSVEFVNCGNADNPSQLLRKNYRGTVESTMSIYRTDGASVEDVANTAWAITTSSVCSECWPLYTPWIYGRIASAGTKTFTMAFAQENGQTALQNDEIWLEVEVLGTADAPNTTLYSDQRADVVVGAADQDTDAISTWNGFVGAAVQQSLIVASKAVGESGLFRFRAAIAAPSLNQTTHKLHIDPKVTVS